MKIDEQKANWELQDNQMARALVREVNTHQKKIYDETLAATAIVAKKHGIDLVLVNNDQQLPANVQDANPEQLKQRPRPKLLLYVSDKIDITDEVTTTMDAIYKAAASAPH